MKTISFCLTFLCFLLSGKSSFSQVDALSLNEMQDDFLEFRNILESNHCCLYEYTSKTAMDSLFDAHFQGIEKDLSFEGFFRLMAGITAKIGCMHTAAWMPGRFFNERPGAMFPLKIKLINNQAVVTGSYSGNEEVPAGSILLGINGTPKAEIVDQLREVTSADAFNPYFVDAQLTRRFSMFFASVYGIHEGFSVRYLLPATGTEETKQVRGAGIEAVRAVVFAHFRSPPLRFSINEEMNTAIMTVSTFIYYTETDYFRGFMDSCFALIRERNVGHLILDLRGNGGGDPFCASILLSYLEKSPVQYFAESYPKYGDLAMPIPQAVNHFQGKLYVLIDGSCGSTNGHFCSLLKYHHIGQFVGTPGGSTYKCNSGKNTEFTLTNSHIIITIGRTTYAAAVQHMDKRDPIFPDIPVIETYDDFLNGRDAFVESTLDLIRNEREKEWMQD